MAKHEYRCTRSDLYPVNTPGHKDLSARQGHYILAHDVGEASTEMAKRFPRDRNFTVDMVKENAECENAACVAGGFCTCEVRQ